MQQNAPHWSTPVFYCIVMIYDTWALIRHFSQSPSVTTWKLSQALALTGRGSQAALLVWAKSAGLKANPRHLMAQLTLFHCIQLAKLIQGVLFKLLTCLLFLPSLQADVQPDSLVAPFIFYAASIYVIHLITDASSALHLNSAFYTCLSVPVLPPLSIVCGRAGRFSNKALPPNITWWI